MTYAEGPFRWIFFLLLVAGDVKFLFFFPLHPPCPGACGLPCRRGGRGVRLSVILRRQVLRHFSPPAAVPAEFVCLSGVLVRSGVDRKSPCVIRKTKTGRGSVGSVVTGRRRRRSSSFLFPRTKRPSFTYLSELWRRRFSESVLFFSPAVCAGERRSR